MSTEVSMKDGKKVTSHCLLFCEDNYFNSLMEEMLEDRDTVVGLEMEYVHVGTKISLLSLCTSRTCALIDLARLYDGFPTLFKNLSVFLNSKDIVFGCVRKADDLVKLKEEYGLEIRNVVEVSELAARVYRQPQLGFLGVRKLAACVRVLGPEPRSAQESWFDWTAGRRGGSLSKEEVECATVDAYAAYKVTKSLMNMNNLFVNITKVPV